MEYADKTETELEELITAESSDDIKYILGRHLVDGHSDKIPKNESKGLNWIREAANNSHYLSQEFVCYHEVKFEKTPNIKRILTYLANVCDNTTSTRAANTLAEFSQMQNQDEKTPEKVFSLYKKSADEGCLIG